MHHIAQINIARAVAPLADPQLADFANRLEEIYRLAESSPGFIWRLRAEEVMQAAIQPQIDERLFATISVWVSIEALKTFVYGGDHIQIMKRRREWFIPLKSSYLALWWIPVGHTPDIYEAQERLNALRRDGPTPFAFSFTKSFPEPDRVEVKEY